MNLVLVVMLVTIMVTTIPALVILAPFIVRKLAELETFWATCKEGQARPVTRNKKFNKFIMSYAGRCFAGELPDSTHLKSEAEYWEVVKDTRPHKNRGWLEGIYRIGVPPFAEIQRYKMTWIEWGFPKKADGTVSIDKAPISHEETISHILVQTDIYFFRASAAETSEGAPYDLNFLLTINVINPYKALYRVQHWLEAVTNQAEATARVFIGTNKAEELFTVEEGTDAKTVSKVTLSPTSSKLLLEAMGDRLEEFRDEYGVNVELIQIQSVEPAGKEAEKYRQLLTMKYEAEKNAEKKQIEADAEAKRIKTIALADRDAAKDVFGAIAGIAGGAEMYHSQQVAKLENLRVYVEGSGGKKKPKTMIALPTEEPGE